MTKKSHAQEATASAPVLAVDKRELARLLNCHVRTVSNLQRVGLPHWKVTPRMVRFDPVQCRQWMADRFEVSRLGPANPAPAPLRLAKINIDQEAA